MNLLETLGDIFNPQSNLETYKKRFYDNWIIFKHLTPSDDLFQAYLDLVDSEIDYLKTEFGYFPDYEKDYESHYAKYFDVLEFKVSCKENKILSSKEIKYKFILN